MITIISGTNRSEANSLKVAKLAETMLKANGAETKLLDLNQLPRDLFVPEHYGEAPESFAPYQDAVLQADGILTVVPEYNGSYPGALKYFIDLLRFPESFRNQPCAFIGISAGVFGSLRSIEHLQMVFQYRDAKLFNKYVLFPKVHEKLSQDGKHIRDEFTRDMMDLMLREFIQFCADLKASRDPAV